MIWSQVIDFLFSYTMGINHNAKCKCICLVYRHIIPYFFFYNIFFFFSDGLKSQQWIGSLYMYSKFTFTRGEVYMYYTLFAAQLTRRLDIPVVAVETVKVVVEVRVNQSTTREKGRERRVVTDVNVYCRHLHPATRLHALYF